MFSKIYFKEKKNKAVRKLQMFINL